MRYLCAIILAGSVLWLGACGDSHSGTCNYCPGSMTSYNASACTDFGVANGCTATVTEVTDDGCGVGEDPTTHPACEYEGCGESFDCSTFASY